jgi:hypothetical protein
MEMNSERDHTTERGILFIWIKTKSDCIIMGKARMYSFIMGGPARKDDMHIAEEFNMNF